jgi:hypothetical protein
MQVAGVERNALNSRGVADVDKIWVVGRIEGDTKGMVQAGCEFLDLRGFAVRAYAAKDEDGPSAGVGKVKIAVGGRSNEARHGECAAADSHYLLVVGMLHRGRVATCIEGDFEAGGRERPSIGGTGNNVWRVVHSLIGIRLGRVGKSDLAANARPLQAPIRECGLTGDGLPRR